MWQFKSLIKIEQLTGTNQEKVYHLYFQQKLYPYSHSFYSTSILIPLGNCLVLLYFHCSKFHQLSIFERLLHLLFNSFLPTLIRTLDSMKQRSKTREIIFSLVFLGLANIFPVYFGFPSGSISWSFIPGTIHKGYIVLDVSFCGDTTELLILGVVL